MADSCDIDRNSRQSRKTHILADALGAIRSVPALFVLGPLCLGIILVAKVAMSEDLPRGALWSVVRSCTFVQQTFGISFPCFAVQTGPEGFAILRVPGSRTHFIVTPTNRVVGLESRPQRAALASGAWRAALDFRSALSDLAGTTPGNVALAINPRRARGQDQLHIHTGCADPELLGQIRSLAPSIGSTWARLDQPIDGVAFWARRVEHASVQDGNPFTSLPELPKSQVDPTNVVFEAFGLSSSGTGDLVLLVTQTAGTSAEDAIDPSCSKQS